LRFNGKEMILPMTYFTNEDLKPSEQTLHVIREIAHCYRTIYVNGEWKAYCLN